MNVNDIFPSKYVKAHDLGGKNVTVTIRTATMEELGHGSEKERKLVIWFEKATKGLVTNRTNAMIIAGMYGPETDGWKGKQITIYSARVKAFGAVHDAVRVREQKPTGSTGAPMPPAMNEPPPIDDEEDLLDVDEGDEQRPVDTETGEITSGADNPFEDTPTEAELAILGKWTSPVEAKAWAISVGACLNDIEAGNSFKKVVNAHGGHLTASNIAAVYLAFLRRQNEKLAEKKEAA